MSTCTSKNIKILRFKKGVFKPFLIDLNELLNFSTDNINCEFITFSEVILKNGFRFSIISDDESLITSGVKYRTFFKNGLTIFGDFIVVGGVDSVGDTCSYPELFQAENEIERCDMVEIG